MNLFVGLLITIFTWVVFTTLNEIKVAGGDGDSEEASTNGCCGNGSCGKSVPDNVFWWVTLIVCIFFTFAVLFKFYEEFTSPGSSLPGGIPVPDMLGSI
jgi:uncharacterized membrane protein